MCSNPLCDSAGDRPVRVLLTGFGPFAHFTHPTQAWTAVESWDGQILDHAPYEDYDDLYSPDTSTPGTPDTESDDSSLLFAPSTGKQIHITAIQLPVCYQTVLEAVPVLHGLPPQFPASTERKSRGSPDYDIDQSEILERFPPVLVDDRAAFTESPIPPPYTSAVCAEAAGQIQPYDLYIHVGVGLGTHVKLERNARRAGFECQPGDLLHRKPPLMQPLSLEEELEAEQLELGGPPRGFAGAEWDLGEDCPDGLLSTAVDVYGLTRWLTETAGLDHIKVSERCGLYMCEYLNWCTQASAIRAARIATKIRGEHVDPTPALFVHVPKYEASPLEPEQVQHIIGNIIWGAVHEPGRPKRPCRCSRPEKSLKQY